MERAECQFCHYMKLCASGLCTKCGRFGNISEVEIKDLTTQDKVLHNSKWFDIIGIEKSKNHNGKIILRLTADRVVVVVTSYWQYNRIIIAKRPEMSVA